MRCCRLALVCVSFMVLSWAAFGQTVVFNPHPEKQLPAPDATPNVSRDTPVITIEGFCDNATNVRLNATASPIAESATPATPTNSACTTVVTRAQFENMIANASSMSPQAKLSLAVRYAEMLMEAQQARQLGLENDPRFAESVRFGYTQVLAQTFSRYLQERDLTDAEVETFYRENPAAFVEVELEQLTIPASKLHSGGSELTASKSDKAGEAATMKLEAEKIRQKAVAGGDFEQLEEEVYSLVGDSDGVPEPDLGTLTLVDLPIQYQKEVAALPPGEVSELIADREGWSVFKVVTKRTIPLSQAKPIARRRLEKSTMDSIRKSIKSQLNDAYFQASANLGTKPSGAVEMKSPHP